jgi:hypothetical protein
MNFDKPVDTKSERRATARDRDTKRKQARSAKGSDESSTSEVILPKSTKKASTHVQRQTASSEEATNVVDEVEENKSPKKGNGFAALACDSDSD